MIPKFIFILMILNGCATVASGPFNEEHLQNQDCYNSYGGEHGYCDAYKHRGHQ